MIRDARPRYHMPLVMHFAYIRAAPLTKPKREIWDFDALADALAGSRREPFLQAIEEAFEQAKPILDKHEWDNTPDEMSDVVMKTVREVGLRFFSLEATEAQDKQERTEKRKLVKKRGELRVRLLLYAEQTHGLPDQWDEAKWTA